MFSNPFDGARVKVDRARKHCSDLIAIEEAFAKTEPLDVITEVQANGDTKAFAVVTHRPPPEAAAITADAIGNLRSSLDIAVNQACRVRGETDEDKLGKTYFAFGGSEKDWDGNSPRRMVGADTRIRSIVRGFKPWKDDGNATLYALSKIAAKDKHVDLVPVASRPKVLTLESVKATRPDGRPTHFKLETQNWGQSDRVLLFSTSAPAKVEITGPHSFRPRIGFGQVYGMTGEPVIPYLNHMCGMCQKIVDIIEAAARRP